MPEGVHAIVAYDAVAEALAGGLAAGNVDVLLVQRNIDHCRLLYFYCWLCVCGHSRS